MFGLTSRRNYRRKRKSIFERAAPTCSSTMLYFVPLVEMEIKGFNFFNLQVFIFRAFPTYKLPSNTVQSIRQMLQPLALPPLQSTPCQIQIPSFNKHASYQRSVDTDHRRLVRNRCGGCKTRSGRGRYRLNSLVQPNSGSHRHQDDRNICHKC